MVVYFETEEEQKGYAHGGDPMVRDRVSDKESRISMVTHVSGNHPEYEQVTIKWYDGIVGIRYSAEEFTLISKAPERR